MIEQTDQAIRLMGEQLGSLGVKEAFFYRDAPVSNTGRLRSKMIDLLRGYSFQTTIELVPNADTALKGKHHVVTSDAIVLNQCSSWINLVSDILINKVPDTVYVNLGE